MTRGVRGARFGEYFSNIQLCRIKKYSVTRATEEILRQKPGTKSGGINGVPRQGGYRGGARGGGGGGGGGVGGGVGLGGQ